MMLDVPGGPVQIGPDRRKVIEWRVRELLDLRSRGDLQGLAARLAPDFVYRARGAWPMWPYYGGPMSRSQFTGAVARVNAEFDLVEWDSHEFLVEGESVAAHVTVSARNRGAGAPVEFDIWFYFRFREELLAEAAMYVDAARAARLLPGGLVEVHPHAGARARSPAVAEPPSQRGAVRTDAAASGETENGAPASVRERMAMERAARGFFALRAKGDSAAMLGRLAPDFVYNPLGTWTKAPLMADRCDRATFAESLRLVNVEFEDLGGEVHEMVVDGDRIAVHRTIRVRNRGAGEIAQVDEWVCFRVRTGLIVEMASYVDSVRAAQVDKPPYAPPR